MAKHIPQRTCVGCREVQGKRQLVRVVRQADGHVRLDRHRQGPRARRLCSCSVSVLESGLKRRAVSPRT